MRKVYEGATIVSAVFLILTALTAFVFNVNHQRSHAKQIKKHERKMEKMLRKKSEFYQKLEKEKVNLIYEDPEWEFLDKSLGETPGKALPSNKEKKPEPWRPW